MWQQKNYNKNQLDNEIQIENPKSTNSDKTLKKGKHGGIAPTGMTKLSLPDIVQRFKKVKDK